MSAWAIVGVGLLAGVLGCASGDSRQCLVEGFGTGPCCTFEGSDGQSRDGACLNGACTDGREFDRSNETCGGDPSGRDQGFSLRDSWVAPPDMGDDAAIGGAGGTGGGGGTGGVGGAQMPDAGAGGGGGMGGGVENPCAVTVCDPGQTCNPATGDCQSRPAGPCASDEGCQVGSCTTEADAEGAVPDGFCAVLCAADAECAGGLCMPNGDESLCFASCGPARPCRTGWACLDVLDAEGDPTDQDRCLPDCREPAVGCSEGFVCDQETGGCAQGPEPCRYPCQGGEACQDGRCVRANGTCDTDYHCPLNTHACVQGRCVVSEFSACANGAQCDPALQSCFQFEDGGLCLFSCAADEECPAHRTCFSNDRVCYWRVCGPGTENGTVWGACQAGAQNQWPGTCLPLPVPAAGQQQIGLCFEAGNVPEGGACDEQSEGRGPDARAVQCDSGMLCFGDADDSLNPDAGDQRGACRQMCDPRRPRCSTPNRTCVDFSTRDEVATPNNEARFIGLCLASDCTVMLDDCPAGDHCRSFGLAGAQGQCGPAGQAGIGEACGEDADCSGLALCANAGAGSVCLQLCDPAQAACAEGTACRQEDGWGFGICL